MTLHLPGQDVGIAQMGPDFFILSEALTHPPCKASVTQKIDEHVRRWQVTLPMGIEVGMKRVPVVG